MGDNTETIKFSVATTVADTYHETQEALEQEIGAKRRGKRGSATKVMFIKEIVVEWPAWTTPPVAADNYELQITTNTEPAMVTIDDKDCFFKAKRQSTGVNIEVQNIVEHIPVNKPYIKKDMWIGVCSAGNGGTVTFRLELNFEYRYLNDWQMARMIGRKA